MAYIVLPSGQRISDQDPNYKEYLNQPGIKVEGGTGMPTQPPAQVVQPAPTGVTQPVIPQSSQSTTQPSPQPTIQPTAQYSGGLTEKQIQELNIANARVQQGIGTDIDRKNLVYAQQKYGWTPSQSIQPITQEPSYQLPDFNIEPIPSVVPVDYFEKIDFDIDSIRNKYQEKFEELKKLLLPTETENELEKQLADLRLEADKVELAARAGIRELEEQPITLRASRGEARKIEKRANEYLQTLSAKEKNLISKLNLEKEARKTAVDIAKMGLEFAQQDFNNQLKLIDVYNQQLQQYETKVAQLRDDARQSLSLILNQFGGIEWKDLDVATKSMVAQLAQQAGIPLSVLTEGMTLKKQNMMFQQELKQAQLELSYAKAAPAGTTTIVVNPFTGQEAPIASTRVVRSGAKSDVKWTDYGLADGSLIRIISDLQGNPLKQIQVLAPGQKPISEQTKIQQALQIISLAQQENKPRAQVEADLISLALPIDDKSVQEALNKLPGAFSTFISKFFR